MKIHRYSVILLAAMAALVATAAEKKRVVTTFTIIQDMAQNVAGDAAIVESITKPGAEIHGYEPTPQDIVKAQKADLVLWNGLNLERWFEKFFGNLKGVPRAVLTEGIEPIGIEEGPYTGKPNPHSWMSPRNAVIYVENIRRALAQLDRPTPPPTTPTPRPTPRNSRPSRRRCGPSWPAYRRTGAGW
jgi:manganese/iron transport system substrate-binding protein